MSVAAPCPETAVPFKSHCVTPLHSRRGPIRRWVNLSRCATEWTAAAQPRHFRVVRPAPQRSINLYDQGATTTCCECRTMEGLGTHPKHQEPDQSNHA